nr:hypothetical protein Itr_chr09CG14920 [Ipomoea trifida]
MMKIRCTAEAAAAPHRPPAVIGGEVSATCSTFTPEGTNRGLSTPAALLQVTPLPSTRRGRGTCRKTERVGELAARCCELNADAELLASSQVVNPMKLAGWDDGA